MIHGSGGLLLSVKSQGLLWIFKCLSLRWRVLSEVSFCPASSVSAIKIVQKPTNFCMIFIDMKKVPVTCLSLNNPKGRFGLRTNSLLQGFSLIFFYNQVRIPCTPAGLPLSNCQDCTVLNQSWHFTVSTNYKHICLRAVRGMKIPASMCLMHVFAFPLEWGWENTTLKICNLHFSSKQM